MSLFVTSAESRWIIEVYAFFPSLILIVTNHAKINNMLSRTHIAQTGQYAFGVYVFQTASMTIQYLMFGMAGFDNWYSETVFMISVISTVLFGMAMGSLLEKLTREVKFAGGKIT